MLKKTFYISTVMLMALVIFTACGVSPKSKGRTLAERMNENWGQYLVDRSQVEINYVNNFTPSRYTNREEALEEYNLLVDDVDRQFQSIRDEVLKEYDDVEGELLRKDYKNLAAFETAYENTLDRTLEARVLEKLNEVDYPRSVMAKIMTIIPSKPDIDKIKNDLVTETITEGLDKDQCWFSDSQRWNISKYNIDNFTIEEVIRDNDKEYIIIASMRLVSDRNAFDAKVKISYILPDTGDWRMEYVTSMGVSIVRTHKYDGLVSCELKDDGWGGVDALFITNKSNIELVVGVDYVAGGNKYRTAVMVIPDKQSKVGGVFCGGNVTSYEVGFVERY